MYAEFEAAQVRHERAHQHDVSVAYHTAVFALLGFGGKLKPLASYVHGAQRPLTQVEHLQQQRATMLMIAETRGLRVRTKES